MTTEIGSPNYGNTRIAFSDEKYKINFNEWNDISMEFDLVEELITLIEFIFFFSYLWPNLCFP